MQYPQRPERLQIERRAKSATCADSCFCSVWGYAECPFTDDEPTPRYCWRCEQVTRQTRTESGGQVWWMCNVCTNSEQERE